jgi:hypothetical protein
MASVPRVSMRAGVAVCLLITQWPGALFASEAGSPPSTAAVSPLPTTAVSEAQAPTSLGLVNAAAIDGQSVGLRLPFDALSVNAALGAVEPPRRSAFDPPEFSRFAGQVYQGAPYPYRRRHDGSLAAIMIGATAAITGGALLAYANRPECTANAVAGGCGYGARVAGTAVLSGGIVSLFVGALTWR